MRAVIDTSVLVSALRSSNGASAAVVNALPSPKFKTVVSIPLYCEYLDVLNRPGMVPSHFTPPDILAVCRYVASVSIRQQVYFLWGPLLPDPKDDMVLEVAVAAQASYIVTHNVRDFGPALSFGIRAIRPGDFISMIKGLP
jgi:putative PIN family toxin of toxin-antitoxin system